MSIGPRCLAATIANWFERVLPMDARIGKFTLTLGRCDKIAAEWMHRHGQLFLRLSLGIVFIWLGALKPLGISPVNHLIANTVPWPSPDVFIPILGYWEMLIGVGLLVRPLIRMALTLLFLQIFGTALPLVLLPQVCFTSFPFGLTLEGQYIVKNLVIISAAIVIGGGLSARSKAAVLEPVPV